MKVEVDITTNYYVHVPTENWDEACKIIDNMTHAQIKEHGELQDEDVEIIQGVCDPCHEDPLQQRDGKWYWWDETWTIETGPFETKKEAHIDCIGLEQYETFKQAGWING